MKIYISIYYKKQFKARKVANFATNSSVTQLRLSTEIYVYLNRL